MLKKQEKIDITTGSLKNILGRMPNWKSPGPNLVQGFWLKSFSGAHETRGLEEGLHCYRKIKVKVT